MARMLAKVKRLPWIFCQWVESIARRSTIKQVIRVGDSSQNHFMRIARHRLVGVFASEKLSLSPRFASGVIDCFVAIGI